IQRSADPGTPDFRIFNNVFPGEVFISGLTVNNGRDVSGAGIQNGTPLTGATLTLSNLVIVANIATNASNSDGLGGGLYNHGSGTLAIYDSVISSNRAEGGNATGFGGGILNLGDLVL